jgi:prepilin-type N-terminal cleavage/methylation domain-containing protein
MLKFSLKKGKGFTLIELLVVISIIAFFSILATISLNSARAKARDSIRLAQVEEVVKALDIYYSNHEQYPSHSMSGLANSILMVPYFWADLIKKLDDENLIKATFTANLYNFLNQIDSFLIKQAYAVGVAPNYYPCSLQDPLYHGAYDYNISYGYQSSSEDNSQHYIIRLHLENLNHSALQNSLEGAFLDSSLTGETACDKSLGYYCIGK